MTTMETGETWDEDYDFVVLGAGAGGMTAALVAGIEGMRTLLIEKSDQIGGTTARSSGTVWIPDNPEQRRLAITDDAAKVRTYLDALVGDRADPSLREAFISISQLQLRHHARRLRAGRVLNNVIDVETLRPLTRVTLQEALREVAAAQKRFA